MIKRNLLPIGLSAGILAGLVFLSGCIPTETPQAEGGFNWTAIVMVVVLIILFYLFIIRPQNKRRKEQQKLMEELKVGDQVITASGIYGEIESISNESIVIKVESGTKLRVLKQGLMVRRNPELMAKYK